MTSSIIESAASASNAQEEAEDFTQGSLEQSFEETIADSEYAGDVARIVADSLITSQGEVLADVVAGVRDALVDIRESLDKLNKVLYNKLNK